MNDTKRRNIAKNNLVIPHVKVNCKLGLIYVCMTDDKWESWSWNENHEQSTIFCLFLHSFIPCWLLISSPVFLFQCFLSSFLFFHRLLITGNNVFSHEIPGRLNGCEHAMGFHTTLYIVFKFYQWVLIIEFHRWMKGILS